MKAFILKLEMHIHKA